jgi:malate dehydrogenase
MAEKKALCTVHPVDCEPPTINQPTNQGLTIDDKSAAKLKATAEELVEERTLALECIGEAAK